MREEKIFEEIMAKNVPNLVKEKTYRSKIKKNHQTPNKINLKKLLFRYITIKLLHTKDKEKLLKAIKFINNRLFSYFPFKFSKICLMANRKKNIYI